jgi:hypothetical protein
MQQVTSIIRKNRSLIDISNLYPSMYSQPPEMPHNASQRNNTNMLN